MRENAIAGIIVGSILTIGGIVCLLGYRKMNEPPFMANYTKTTKVRDNRAERILADYEGTASKTMDDSISLQAENDIPDSSQGAFDEISEIENGNATVGTADFAHDYVTTSTFLKIFRQNLETEPMKSYVFDQFSGSSFEFQENKESEKKYGKHVLYGYDCHTVEYDFVCFDDAVVLFKIAFELDDKDNIVAVSVSSRSKAPIDIKDLSRFPFVSLCLLKTCVPASLNDCYVFLDALYDNVGITYENWDYGITVAEKPMSDYEMYLLTIENLQPKESEKRVISSQTQKDDENTFDQDIQFYQSLVEEIFPPENYEINPAGKNTLSKSFFMVEIGENALSESAVLNSRQFNEKIPVLYFAVRAKSSYVVEHPNDENYVFPVYVSQTGGVVVQEGDAIIRYR